MTCCTLITHTDLKKEIRYERDPVVIATGIATYTYKDIPEKTIQEIEQATTDQVQLLLSKLF